MKDYKEYKENMKDYTKNINRIWKITLNVESARCEETESYRESEKIKCWRKKNLKE